MSRDARWLNLMQKHYKRNHNYARRQVELLLDEEENLCLEGNEPVKKKKFCLDIGIIGVREETLGRTWSQTQEKSSPRMKSGRLDSRNLPDLSGGTNKTKDFSGVMALPNRKRKR